MVAKSDYFRLYFERGAGGLPVTHSGTHPGSKWLIKGKGMTLSDCIPQMAGDEVENIRQEGIASNGTVDCISGTIVKDGKKKPAVNICQLNDGEYKRIAQVDLSIYDEDIYDHRYVKVMWCPVNEKFVILVNAVPASGPQKQYVLAIDPITYIATEHVFTITDGGLAQAGCEALIVGSNGHPYIIVRGYKGTWAWYAVTDINDLNNITSKLVPAAFSNLFWGKNNVFGTSLLSEASYSKGWKSRDLYKLDPVAETETKMVLDLTSLGSANGYIAGSRCVVHLPAHNKCITFVSLIDTNPSKTKHIAVLLGEDLSVIDSVDVSTLGYWASSFYDAVKLDDDKVFTHTYNAAMSVSVSGDVISKIMWTYFSSHAGSIAWGSAYNAAGGYAINSSILGYPPIVIDSVTGLRPYTINSNVYEHGGIILLPELALSAAYNAMYIPGEDEDPEGILDSVDVPVLLSVVTGGKLDGQVPKKNLIINLAKEEALTGSGKKEGLYKVGSFVEVQAMSSNCALVGPGVVVHVFGADEDIE